mmetsp:Transcript_36067/g.93798  ORF Transcript_36067/g.93798 Transcript_36067/m.93798 type:complete len:136 (-) Transcript_36067:481-888(-)
MSMMEVMWRSDEKKRREEESISMLSIPSCYLPLFHYSPTLPYYLPLLTLDLMTALHPLASPTTVCTLLTSTIAFYLSYTSMPAANTTLYHCTTIRTSHLYFHVDTFLHTFTCPHPLLSPYSIPLPSMFCSAMNGA